MYHDLYVRLLSFKHLCLLFVPDISRTVVLHVFKIDIRYENQKLRSRLDLKQNKIWIIESDEDEIMYTISGIPNVYI